MVLIKVSRDQQGMNASIQRGIGMSKDRLSQVLCRGRHGLGVFSTGAFLKEPRNTSFPAVDFVIVWGHKVPTLKSGEYIHK